MALTETVTVMRALGVVQFGDIVLGPAPSLVSSPDEDSTQRSERLDKAERERVNRVRFGASGGPRPLVKT